MNCKLDQLFNFSDLTKTKNLLLLLMTITRVPHIITTFKNFSTLPVFFLLALATTISASAASLDEVYAREPTTSYVLVLDANFENKMINSGILGLNSDVTKNDSITIDCSKSRKGECSLKSLIRNSEDYIVFGALRSETSASKVPGVIYKSGDHYRYLFSLYIDVSYEKSDIDSLESVWQFKRFGSGPDMFLAIKNNSIVWRITESDQIILVNPLVRGKWIDFDFDINWSDQNNGKSLLDLTIDGITVMYSFFGRNMRHAVSQSGTIQWGIYKPGDHQKFDFKSLFVNHDEIKVMRLR